MYLKFLDSQKIIQCTVVPESEHIVTLKFHDAVTLDKSGFDLFFVE